MSALSGILGHFKSDFRIKKVSGNFSDYEERQVGKKSKKKKKFFEGMFSLAVFLFPVIKRGKKVSGFCFLSVRGEGKCEIDYK